MYSIVSFCISNAAASHFEAAVLIYTTYPSPMVKRGFSGVKMLNGIYELNGNTTIVNIEDSALCECVQTLRSYVKKDYSIIFSPKNEGL